MSTPLGLPGHKYQVRRGHDRSGVPGVRPTRSRAARGCVDACTSAAHPRASTRGPQQSLSPDEARARIEVLKKLLNQRLENKSSRNEGNASCLRKALRFTDIGATNKLNHEQWIQAFVRLGAQLSDAVSARPATATHSPHVCRRALCCARACALGAGPYQLQPLGADARAPTARGARRPPQDLNLLFYAFATEEDEGGAPAVDYVRFVDAMTSGDDLGPLRGADFVTVMSDRHGARPREGKRTYDDRLFNKPPPYALGDSEPNPQPRRVAEKTTNTPSVAGGIFAIAPPIVAPEVPSVKNFSTLSLAHSEWKPSDEGEHNPAFGTTVKRMSNTSSVPGGIFAPGSADDFRVRGLFVRPGY